MGIFSWLFQDLTNIRIASQEARNGEVTSLIDKIFETYLKTQDRNYFIDTLVNSNEINVFFEKDKTSDSTKPETPIGRNPSQRSNINFENKELLRSFIGTIFDDLNTQDLESHAKRIFSDTIKNRGHVPKDKEKIPAFIELFRIFFPEELTDAEKEVQINKKNESIIQSYRFLVMLRRAANEREEPKNLPEVLKKINPYCDPSEEKIQKVIEEYKKYKESDSDEKDLPKKQECKTALKQAIDDALKTCIPPQKAYHMQMSDEDKDDYLHWRIVNEAFDANQTSSPQKYELLQRLQKVTTDEFNKIVSFLDRMPKAELNASLGVHQSSIQMQASGELMDESEPRPEAISDSNIKRDKVAEFKKFLEDNNLNCTDDNIQKVFALHELYEAYEAFGKIEDREYAAEISSNTKKRLRDQIEKILLPNATEQSVQQENDITKNEMSDDMLQEVPKSSIKIEKEGKDSEIVPHGKPNDAKIDEILKYLSEHNKQKKQDNKATDQLNFDQKSNLDDLRKKNVLQFLNIKFPSFTDSRIKKIIDFYEKYASEPEEDKKLKFKVEFIMAIADGINVQNNINALDTLKTLDELNKNNIDDIKKAEGKAKQEKPNEIIKFFEDLPNTILSVFDCIRTKSENGKGPQ